MLSFTAKLHSTNATQQKDHLEPLDVIIPRTLWFLKPFCLAKVARAIPGGVRTMAFLAWHSPNAKAREVARRWGQRSADDVSCGLLEELCSPVGVEVGEFISAIAATAWELDPSMSAMLMGGIEDALCVFEATLNRFLAGKRTVQPSGLKAGRDQLASRGNGQQPRCALAALRRRWGLTQSQLAQLLMVSVRTVECWEARRARPGWQRRWFLALFARYARQHGIGAFRRRFVVERLGTARTNEPTITSR
jgi:DNA-binding XRE family transcriptional regulator